MPSGRRPLPAAGRTSRRSRHRGRGRGRRSGLGSQTHCSLTAPAWPQSPSNVGPATEEPGQAGGPPQTHPASGLGFFPSAERTGAADQTRQTDDGPELPGRRAPRLLQPLSGLPGAPAGLCPRVPSLHMPLPWETRSPRTLSLRMPVIPWLMLGLIKTWALMAFSPITLRNSGSVR